MIGKRNHGIYLPALYDELKLRLVRASYLHRVGDFEGA